MARVYLAEDQTLGRTVAIKMLHGELSEDDEVQARFLREARIFARLKHAHIVNIYDVLTMPGGEAAMVMEFVDGVDLSRVIRSGQQMIPELAAMVLRPVAAALSYAHRNGVIHRDVKPANILMSREGDVKLSDFGIAKATEESQVTRTGDFLGTPAYIAPEQARGEAIGPAADQYALGAVLYQLVTGSQPFKAPNTLAILAKIMTGDYLDPRSLNPAVDDRLAEIIGQALSLKPEDRFLDLSAFVDALDRYQHRISTDRERRLLAALVDDPSTAVEAVAQEVANEMVTTGRRAADAGDVEHARRSAEAALARQPNHKGARALLATLPMGSPVPAVFASANAQPAKPELPNEVKTAEMSWATRPHYRGPKIVLAGFMITAIIGISVTALIYRNPIRPKVSARATITPAPTAPAVVDAAPQDVAPPQDAAIPQDAASPKDAAPKVQIPKKARVKANRPRKKTADEDAPPIKVKKRPRVVVTPPPADTPKEPGILHIVATPWADVYINGEKRGRTPMVRKITLPPGQYRLELRNPGLPRHKETFEITSGKTLSRRIKLGGSR